jgi:small subunit ribosomal protein S8
MMTDPLADMLTRIRNANNIERPFVEMPATKLKLAVARVLKEEGYVHDAEIGTYETDENGQRHFQPAESFDRAKLVLRVHLKYGPDGERVIRHIGRVSKPGCRVYRGSGEIKKVLDGLGISVLSTSKGVLSDRQARSQKVGGEVICQVW